MAEVQQENSLERLAQLEQEESRLWRLALLFLTLIACGFAAVSLQNLRDIPQRLEAIPIGMFVLGALFAVYAYHKRREVSNLRSMVTAMKESAGAPATAQQLERLLDVVSNSQRGYRELIDSLSDVVLAVSTEGRLIAANRALCELLNLPFTQVIDRSLDDLLAEPSFADVQRYLPLFMEKRRWSGVLRIVPRGPARIFYFDCVLQAIVKEGNVTGISIVAQNITRERERESRFTELFETLQEGVYFTLPEGTILDCNEALVRMLGYDRKEELLKLNARDLYLDPADRQRSLRNAERTGGKRDDEIVLKRKDGQPVYCLDSARAITDTSGQVARYQGALIDITARREMEVRLQREEEFRRRLVDSFPDIILALDTAGHYTFVSPRIREVLGYDPETFVGRSVDDKAPAEGFDLGELCRGLLSGKETFENEEYAVRHRDGSWRALRATASPLFDAGDKMTGVVASVRDVTNVKQLEQQLIHSERMAAMGQMIDGFAHELNNPLTAILGAVELLEGSSHEPTTVGRIKLLKQQARRAAEIVQNLLFFSRPPAKGLAQVNLNDLVHRSLLLHEHSLRVSNIAVDFIPETNLPSCQGDPNQFMQVFLNLIINAEQAIREVRPRGTLRVRIGSNADRVWVAFQDDGPGIPPETLTKIFDPFYTTKRPGRGTGLGLSVCMAILKKYDGDIEAQNAPGGGSVFTVSVPVLKQAARIAGAS